MTLSPLRVAFALPGLHRVDRGAEIAFISVGSELAREGHEVTLIGSGPPRKGAPYRYLQAGLIPRERFERFPRLPALRSETSWEELTFLPGFHKVYRPDEFDVTLTCSFPWMNWALRTRRRNGRRPAHVFVTQNGIWPVQSDDREYGWFGCEGLVCINPEFHEIGRDRYPSALIPNGVDLPRFRAGRSDREAFGLPADKPVVLMVSALIASKQVELGIEAVSRLEGVHLAVAGDGPLRDQLRARADQLMPGRFHNFTTKADRMADVYRSADLFLHLSRDESFGNVYVEAMASGLPTVALDLPRTRWIVGDNATLVPDGNLDALSKGITGTLAEAVNKDRLLQRAASFDWPVIARQYSDFLQDIVSRQKRKPEA